MAIDYQDWQARQAPQREHAAREQRALLDGMQVAAVSAQKLLADPNWQRYQFRVQAMIEAAEKATEGMKAQMLDSATPWEASAFSHLRAHYLIAKARLDALREVMEIPQEMLQAGDAAKELIAESKA